MQCEDSVGKMVLSGNSEIMKLINSSPDLLPLKKISIGKSLVQKNLMKPIFLYYELPVAYRLKLVPL